MGSKTQYVPLDDQPQAYFKNHWAAAGLWMPDTSRLVLAVGGKGAGRWMLPARWVSGCGWEYADGKPVFGGVTHWRELPEWPGANPPGAPPLAEAKCSDALRAAGLAYPRTCEVCGLGPCRFPGGKP